MPHKFKLFVSIFSALLYCLSFSPTISAQEEDIKQSAGPEKLSLVQAVMCEDVRESSPKNQAIVFSVSLGKVICFTSFDHVPERTFIYHNWFYMDEPKSKVKLSLRSPKWSTFSKRNLRESEKGPWRVEVTDSEGRSLKIFWFSIVD
jgi:Protein of unknown function (DUF2914)